MSTANTAMNVTAGKPNPAGAIFAAPVGTPLPTSTADTLNAAFKPLGYVAEDGLTNGTNLAVNKIKAWGGDTVLVIQTSKDDQYKFTLIEVKNIEVLKFVYGPENVSGSLETGITVKANSLETPERSLVIDMLLSENTAKRVVIPKGKISAIGDITYIDNNAVGYETTLDCLPDDEGDSHLEYIKKAVISG